MLAGVATFIAVVATLHFLQPGYDPSTQLMSELALGRYGGAMTAAFGGLAVAVFGIQASIGASGAGKGLRAVLVGAAAFFLLAGIFPLGAASGIHIAAIATALWLTIVGWRLRNRPSSRC